MQCGRAQEEPQRQGVFLQLTWTQREHVNKPSRYIISPFFLEGSSLYIPLPRQVFSMLTRAQPRSAWGCLIPHFPWHSVCTLTLAIPLLVFYYHHEVHNFELQWSILDSIGCIANLLQRFKPLPFTYWVKYLKTHSIFCVDIKGENMTFPLALSSG